MTAQTLTLLIMLAGAPSATSMRQQRPHSSANFAAGSRVESPSDPSVQRQQLDLERQKLAQEIDADREKIRLDWARLEFDKSNASRSLLTSTLPLLVGFATLGFSIWSFRNQGKQQSEMQLTAAKLQFDVKAAEIAFTGKTPEAVRNRALALKAMFKERLPENFADSFDPAQHGGGKETPDDKKFFMELLLKYPGKQAEIVALWSALFGDGWLNRVTPLINQGTATEEN